MHYSEALPDCTQTGSLTLRVAVLPPVLGPVMITARTPAFTNTSMATMRFLTGTYVQGQL